MKKLGLVFLCFPLFCSVVFATDSIVVGLGSVSGKTTVSEEASFSDLLLGHDTTGSSWNVEYQKILENGLLFGGGYQNFEVSGSTTFLLSKSETEKFQVSGIYGVIGYNLETTENLFFQPNLRLGIANKLEAKYSQSTGGLLSEPTVSTLSGSQSGTTLGIALPLVYQLENFNIGGQLIVPTDGLVLKNNVGQKVTVKLSAAFQLMVGYNLEL